MGKNHLRTSLIKFNYEDELEVYIPEVDDRQIDREIEDWFNIHWHRNRGRGGTYHHVEHSYPWTRIRRILCAFEGKPFDDAFSLYCSEVPVYQQHDFLNNVDKTQHTTVRRHNNTHYIDDNGLIQAYPGVVNGHYTYKTNRYIVTSLDYKTELRHKVTGAKKPSCGWTGLPYNWKSRYPRMSQLEAQKAFDSDYEEVCVAGWKKEFEGNTREYRRLSADIEKQRRKMSRLKDAENAKKAYSFLTKAEQEQKKYDADNNRKIVRKGFDLVTSFRNEKQTNPDLIKKAQGFALSDFDFWTGE